MIRSLFEQAGLFSAVLSAFVIETYPTLREDSADTTNLILTQISSQLASLSVSTSFVNSTTPPFITPTQTATQPSSVVINTLWSCSLVISLITASLGILVKQWFHEFTAQGTQDPRYRIRIRFFRNEGLERWQVFEIAAALPLLLQLAVLLFFIGLSVFLHDLNVIVGWITTSISLTWLLVFSFTTLAPIVSSQCPYKTPILRQALRYLRPKVQSMISSALTSHKLLPQYMTHLVLRIQWRILPARPRNRRSFRIIVERYQSHLSDLLQAIASRINSLQPQNWSLNLSYRIITRFISVAYKPLPEEEEVRQASEIDMDLVVFSDPFFLDGQIRRTLMECTEEFKVLDIFKYHEALGSLQLTDESSKRGFGPVSTPESIPRAKNVMHDAVIHRSRYPNKDLAWYHVLTSILGDRNGELWKDRGIIITQLVRSDLEYGACTAALALYSWLDKCYESTVGHSLALGLERTSHGDLQCM